MSPMRDGNKHFLQRRRSKLITIKIGNPSFGIWDASLPVLCQFSDRLKIAFASFPQFLVYIILTRILPVKKRNQFAVIRE
ncbi:hypothetical protein CEXT_26041 [Caerostris extrusa]|uniref:Uncharacterized protein n=1 Tax=Caerostris extrusa TaxID=172846 RepID=A0AAV4YBL1_CAEEX|nr:hypothetical protein CEXT_26041 [Caerostris extrusa]